MCVCMWRGGGEGEGGVKFCVCFQNIDNVVRGFLLWEDQ